MIDHWSHEHPLSLVDTRELESCYGCEVRFGSREQAYGCSIDGCEYSKLLHQDCSAMAREIRRPTHHPQHILIQRHEPDLGRCDICRRIIWSIGYKSTSLQCKFQMHLRCAQDSDLIDAATRDVDEQRCAIIRHPSHPSHDLKLLRRCTFKCDACSVTSKGSSYTCTADDCQYWIHERCASLPQNFKREDHHHSLSLSFHVPLEYIRFDYKCDVCTISFLPNYWIYHCQLCRYIVHVKCAFDKPARITKSIGKDVILFPTNELVEELITPFVMREKGGTTLIPPIIIFNDELVVNMKYKFLHHQHELTLVSSTSQNPQILGEEEEDEENYGVRSELICDGCITPISSTSNTPSSSSNSKCYYYYMSCSECKYNLHVACFHLPPNVPCLPIHHQEHPLVLQSLDKHQPWEIQYCSVCRYGTNGLFYTCTKCRFKVDIQCACMPDTIHHTAHPQHLLKHVTESDLRRDINRRRLSCAAGCGKHVADYDCYRCCSSSPCDFIVHVGCAVLPASVNSRRWDRQHPLLLTYNATLNRPGDFYCDQCEKQMNPRSWMYHCRACDLYFHPLCFKTTSGRCRNMMLGQEYDVNAETHPHPLTFQLLTTKHRCDICCMKNYEWEGFYCALCNFFICLDYCGEEMIDNGDIKAVD